MAISTQGIAVASARHPWRVIAAWAVTAVLAVGAIGGLLGGALTTEGEPTNNPESERALEARAQAFPGRSPATDAIVISSGRYTVDSAQFRALGARLARDLRRIDGVAAVETRGSPVSLVSADKHAALVQLSVADADYADALIAAVERADASPAFEVTVTGEKTREHDFNELSQDDLKSGELQFGLPAALIILLLVFGGVVAGLVPLLMAMFSIVVALGLTALVAQGFELSVFVVNMLTGMGLALGIDYALFIVSRYREERGRGQEQLDAISATGVTASRAVLFSGTAFVIAMFGMFIVPSSIMRSLAVGAILVGAVSVAAALTLLPALLGLLGDRVDSLRIPLIGSRSTEAANPEGRFWGAVVRRVLRRPGLSVALSVAVLLALAAPIFGMTTGTSGVSALPERFESRQGFVALEREFPQVTTEPTEIVVTERAGQRAARSALAALRSTLADDPRFGPGRIERSADGETAVLSVPCRGRPVGRERDRRRPRPARDDRPGSFSWHGRRSACRWGDGGEHRLLRLRHRSGTDCDRVRARADVRPADDRLPVNRPRGALRRPQPTLGRSGLRVARARLPARRRRGSLRLPAGRIDRSLGTALSLLRALRAFDGLPGLHAQPDQGALRGEARHG